MIKYFVKAAWSLCSVRQEVLVHVKGGFPFSSLRLPCNHDNDNDDYNDVDDDADGWDGKNGGLVTRLIERDLMNATKWYQYFVNQRYQVTSIKPKSARLPLCSWPSFCQAWVPQTAKLGENIWNKDIIWWRWCYVDICCKMWKIAPNCKARWTYLKQRFVRKL